MDAIRALIEAGAALEEARGGGVAADGSGHAGHALNARSLHMVSCLYTAAHSVSKSTVSITIAMRRLKAEAESRLRPQTKWVKTAHQLERLGLRGQKLQGCGESHQAMLFSPSLQNLEHLDPVI